MNLSVRNGETVNLLSFVNEKFASEMVAGYSAEEARGGVEESLDSLGLDLPLDSILVALDALVAGLPVPAAAAAVLSGFEI